MPNSFPGKWFIGESRNDVKMSMEDVLSPDAADVPTDVVPIGRVFIVEQHFDTLQHIVRVLPLIRREVKL